MNPVQVAVLQNYSGTVEQWNSATMSQSHSVTVLQRATKCYKAAVLWSRSDAPHVILIFSFYFPGFTHHLTFKLLRSLSPNLQLLLFSLVHCLQLFIYV